MDSSQFLWALVIAVLVVACQAELPAEPVTSGIEGRVTIGPSSPIIGVGTPSANEPYAAVIVVKDNATGKEMARVQTGPDGSFRVALEADE